MDNQLQQAKRHAAATGEVDGYWKELARAGVLEQAVRSLPLEDLKLGVLLELAGDALIHVDAQNKKAYKEITHNIPQSQLNVTHTAVARDLHVFFADLGAALLEVSGIVINADTADKTSLTTLHPSSRGNEWRDFAELNIEIFNNVPKSAEQIAKEEEEAKKTREEKAAEAKARKEKQELKLYKKLQKKFGKQQGTKVKEAKVRLPRGKKEEETQ